mmetsp:Transcript_61219/g.181051  ORF Transcript_61219/g.181051 Transcript_61219/m.181051 type:complete len:306 (+) Transcript_61219:460-1377(+)
MRPPVCVPRRIVVVVVVVGPITVLHVPLVGSAVRLSRSGSVPHGRETDGGGAAVAGGVPRRLLGGRRRRGPRRRRRTVVVAVGVRRLLAFGHAAGGIGTRVESGMGPSQGRSVRHRRADAAVGRVSDGVPRRLQVGQPSIPIRRVGMRRGGLSVRRRRIRNEGRRHAARVVRRFRYHVSREERTSLGTVAVLPRGSRGKSAFHRPGSRRSGRRLLVRCGRSTLRALPDGLCPIHGRLGILGRKLSLRPRRMSENHRGHGRRRGRSEDGARVDRCPSEAISLKLRMCLFVSCVTHDLYYHRRQSSC